MGASWPPRRRRPRKTVAPSKPRGNRVFRGLPDLAGWGAPHGARSDSACLIFRRSSPPYSRRSGAGGSGPEKSIGWTSSTPERNHTSNSWSEVARFCMNVAAPGPSSTTTTSWVPSGASWSQAAWVVNPVAGVHVLEVGLPGALELIGPSLPGIGLARLERYRHRFHLSPLTFAGCYRPGIFTPGDAPGQTHSLKSARLRLPRRWR